MTSTMAARRSRSGPAPAPRPANDQTTFLSRWLKVWVILLTVVTLVVVVYLVIITNSLANINGNLATADRAVSGAGQDVTSLPNQVDRINGALDGIDKALKPIPAQAGEIVTVLTSVNDKLTSVDASLQDTSAVLSTVLGTVNTVSSTLVDANDPGDRLGVQNIHHRVAAINGRNSPARVRRGGGGPGPFATGGNLSAAEADARAIVGQPRLDQHPPHGRLRLEPGGRHRPRVHCMSARGDRRLMGQAGIVGLNLALVIAFALFAVIELSRVTLAAKQIDDRVETDHHRCRPGLQRLPA